MTEYVTAKSFFVWTEKAEKENPQRSRAGVQIWDHYKHNAPAFMLHDGLIIDSSEFVKSGQADIFDYIEG